MFNYLFPYLTKLLQNKYMIINIEKNMYNLCKNSKYKHALNEMFEADKKHHENIIELLNELGYKVDYQTLPGLKPIENLNEAVKYLLNLKSDSCNLYRYLKLFNFSTKIPFPVNKMLKQESQHIDLLIKLGKSFTDIAYSTTSVIDLVTAYSNISYSLESFKISYSNEDSESKREVIRELIKNTSSTLEDLLKLIKSYTKTDLKVHKILDTDTLWRIADKYNCPVNDITELNSVKNPYDIMPGKILIIPANEE